MANRRDVPGIRPYDSPAGGWGALRATAKAVRDQMDVTQAPLLLLRTNKPDGFDCPGCAWPDKDHTSTFQFCENGAKAVTWEATKRRAPPEFFAAHSISELLEWSDNRLENEGRLTHPLYYDQATDKYRAISWDDAFVRIGEILRSLPDPNMAEFYTSGGTPPTPAAAHWTEISSRSIRRASRVWRRICKRPNGPISRQSAACRVLRSRPWPMPMPNRVPPS